MDNKTKGRIINALRRVSRWVPAKQEAMRRAQVRLEVGKTKKGKPKYRVFYKCLKCKGLFKREEVNADHISPIINPITGFKDWNEYINNLFCTYEKLQILCIECHKIKTNQEKEIRKLHRKPKKKKK